MAPESKPEPADARRLDSLVMLLERIAIALEAIARQKQQSEKNRRIVRKQPPKWGSPEFLAIRAWAKANGVPGIRAEKALAKAGIKSFDEVTRDRLFGVKNCGPVTIRQLLDWAATKST